jgi:hypothetical protein
MFLGKLLMMNSNRIISRENTNHAYERGLVGGRNSDQGERRKASSAKHNPANNAINNQRKAEELRATHALELSDIKYNGEVCNGISVAKTKADSIVLDFHCFKLIVSVQATLQSPCF